MEQFVTDQITAALKYLPKNLLKSYFIRKSSEESREFRKKIGFIRGLCHPTEDFNQIKEANIEWIRIDIPFPFDADGSILKSYEDFKEKCKRFQNNGIKVMAVTPYPRDYIEKGVDIRNNEGEQKVRDIAKFLIEDLKSCISGLQITNEMGIPRFTIPLTLKEAAKFIAVNLEAMHALKNDIIIGYNSAGPEAGLHAMLLPYIDYCDYVGIDIYMGCFFTMPGFIWFFEALCRYLWSMTGKPILIQEFGYLSGGAPKTKAEKKAILQSYGANSEKEAKRNIVQFVDNMPKDFSDHVKYVCGNDPEKYFGFIFKSDIKNHFYRELPAITMIPGCPHTPEGQAKFFEKCIERLYSNDFICGCNIYCYKDPNKCYYCGQEDCPTETRWGLIDSSGNIKPSYKAVRKVFGRIKWLEAVEKK
ncbi:MAG: hypothetical protein IKL47_02195 [Clostridia bacterium]|nr:hypothetical protein [Clostridia bacterium]